MSEIADSIVVKRLTRNLQYRQTYIRIFKEFVAANQHPAVEQLFHSLIEVQQTAVANLSYYLRDLGIETEGLPLYKKLVDQAEQRQDQSSRLHFVRYGLNKAVSWYKMQLTDRQMTADPELKQLLFELGENEAAGLWHTEAVMTILRIRPGPWSRKKPDRKKTGGYGRYTQRRENRIRSSWNKG